MKHLEEVVCDLQNDDDFCDFTKEELIELVKHITNDN